MRKFCKESLCLCFANNSFVKHFTRNGNAPSLSSRKINGIKQIKFFLLRLRIPIERLLSKSILKTRPFELIYAFTSVCFVSFPIRGTIDVRRKGTLNNRRYCFANARLIKRKAGNHVPRSFHRRRHVQVSFRLFVSQLTFAILLLTFLDMFLETWSSQSFYYLTIGELIYLVLIIYSYILTDRIEIFVC